MLGMIIYVASVIAILVITISIVVSTCKKKKSDKDSEYLYNLMPQLNCKECGRPDCMKFAEDVSKGKLIQIFALILKVKAI